MCDHQDGEGALRFFLNFFDGVLHFFFTLRVQGRRRLVKDKNLRFLNQSPSDRNPLLLPTREILQTTRTYVCVETLLADSFIQHELGVGLREGILHVFLGSILVSIS